MAAAVAPAVGEVISFYPTVANLRRGDSVTRLGAVALREPRLVTDLDGFYGTVGLVHLDGVADPVRVEAGDPVDLVPPF